MSAERRRWVFLVLVVAIVLAPVLAFRLLPSGGPATLVPPGPGEAVLSVTTDKASYNPGGNVHLSVVVRNAGGSPLRFDFGSTCQASYRVMDLAGNPVYNDLRNRGCFAALTNFTLGPGVERAFAFTWNQTSDTGAAVRSLAYYTIQGTLAAQPQPLVAQARIYVDFGTTLAFSASTDATSYNPGDAANITVILTNTGNVTAQMEFGNPCFVQFVVSEETLGTVYNSTKWYGCIQVLANLSLKPGDSKTWRFAWNLTTDAGTPLAPGRWYRVTPSFVWHMPPYQGFVTETQEALFHYGP